MDLIEGPFEYAKRLVTPDETSNRVRRHNEADDSHVPRSGTHENYRHHLEKIHEQDEDAKQCLAEKCRCICLIHDPDLNESEDQSQNISRDKKL